MPQETGEYFERIKRDAFSVHYHRGVNKGYSFQLHLIGHSQGRLDNITNDTRTQDIIGYGDTLEEAAKAAWGKKYGAVKSAGKSACDHATCGGCKPKRPAASPSARR